MKKIILGAFAVLVVANTAMARDVYQHHLVKTDEDGHKYIEVCSLDMGLLGCWKYDKKFLIEQ